MALTPRQQRFVEEYLVDLNGARAYRAAGYSARTDTAASAGAARLLANASIAAAVREAQERRSRRTGVTADRVILELARVAFSDLRRVAKFGPDGVELRDADGLSDDDAAAVESVGETVTQGGGSVRVKLHPKLPALKLLGQHLGLFKERSPLEELLALFAPDDAEAVRRRLGELGAGVRPPPPGDAPGPAPPHPG